MRDQPLVGKARGNGRARAAVGQNVDQARRRLNRRHAQEQEIELVARHHRAGGRGRISKPQFFQLLVNLAKQRLIPGNGL